MAQQDPTYLLLNTYVKEGNKDALKAKLSEGIPIDININDDIHIPLMNAAINTGNTNIVKILLEHGADVNGRYKGRPFLHIPVITGTDDVLKVLLDAGADIYSRDISKHDYTILHAAVLSKNKSAMKILCDRPNIPINEGDKNGATPLHFSMKLAIQGLIETLINYPNIDVNIKNLKGETPLHYLGKFDGWKWGWNNNSIKKAISSVADAIKPHILKFDANAQDLNGNTFLHLIFKKMNGEIAEHAFKCFEEIFAEVPESKKINKELKNNDGLTFREVVKNNASFNPSTFHTYVQNKDLANVRHLFNLGAAIDVNIPDKSMGYPLHIAISNSDYEMVKFLLEHGADVEIESNGVSPLCKAINNNNGEILNLLLDFGANLYSRIDSRTPLHYAVAINRYGIVRILLERSDIGINMKDNFGCTPLHTSIALFYSKIAGELLKREDIDFNPRDIYGRTPLHHIVRYRYLLSNVEIAKKRISGLFDIIKEFASKVDVNAQDLNGDTSLHFIYKNLNKELADYTAGLMENVFGESLDSSKRNNDGLTYKEIICLAS